MSTAEIDARIADLNARHEKVALFLRPLNWAYGTALTTALFGISMWLDGHLDASTIAGIAITALVLTAALVLWGISRINHVIHEAARQ